MILFNKPSCLIFLLMTIALKSFGQEGSLYIPYQFPEKISDNYYSKRKEEYNNLITRKPPAGLTKRDVEDFAQLVVYGKADMFLSGEVYIGWTEVEDYLNQILQKILPPELKGKGNIHVYPVRDASFNAGAIHDGTIFFNIGLLADAENEAAVAAIMGHELSHYYYQDLEQSFISNIKADKNKKKKKKNLKAITFGLVHENQNREQTADTAGFRWALNAGYDVHEAIHNFYRFLDDEKTTSNKNRSSSITNVYVEEKPDGTIKEKSLDDLLASHPETSQRIDVLANFCKKNIRNNNLSKFLVKDEVSFKIIQQKARYESLHILLEGLDNTDCIERAFLYYLFDPDNDLYLYYILESIRRSLYLDNSLQNEGFLAEEYARYFVGQDFNILNKLILIVRDEKKLKEVKARQLTDSLNIPFSNYKEAFNYFSTLCKNRKIKEAYLTMALASNNASQRDSLLNAYISFDNIAYKNFAVRFKEGSLYDHKYSKDLILTEGVSFYNLNRFGKSLDLIKTEEQNGEYFDNLSSLKKDFKNIDIKFVSEVMQKSFRDAIDLEKSIYASTLLLIRKEKVSYKNDDFDLFILNPNYFEIFEKYQINSLSFLIADSFDDKREIKNVFNVINPFFYISLLYGNLRWFAYGTDRFSYNIYYLSYEPASKEKLIFYNSSANYKLTKMNFLNAVYYTLIDE